VKTEVDKRAREKNISIIGASILYSVTLLIPRVILLTSLIGGAFFSSVSAQGTETLRSVSSRPGVTQPFILVEPAGPPVASVILFTGGEGVVGFKGSGPFPRGGNFLVRNRQRFAAHGLLTAVIEVPSDHTAGYGRFRTAEAHATDVAAVMTVLRQLAPVPLWLVGTSKGTVSAVNVAARLKTGGPDGIVLTSSITRTAQQTSETVFDAGLSEVRVPTLVVHHEQDACVVTPAADAQGLIGRVRAPRKELRVIQGGAGGASGETACGPFSAHGYFGVDGEVVKVIADWIRQP